MSSFYRSTLSLILVPCLLLASCAPKMQPQPPLPPPVRSAELQAAFQGPLCTRPNGVEWPCSDTDGRLWDTESHLWKAWYEQQHAQAVSQSTSSTPNGWQVAGQIAGGVLLVGTLGVLLALSRNSSYSYHSYNTITTRCSYGTYRSSCTTRY
jgi:hypothetical protein